MLPGGESRGNRLKYDEETRRVWGILPVDLLDY